MAKLKEEGQGFRRKTLERLRALWESEGAECFGILERESGGKLARAELSVMLRAGEISYTRLLLLARTLDRIDKLNKEL